MTPRLVTAPAELPVTVDEAKQHARIFDNTEDDTLIDAYIRQAVSYLDGYTGALGRFIITQTWDMPFEGFCDVLHLDVPDVQTATLSYIDADGVQQAVGTSSYVLDHGHRGGFVWVNPDYLYPVLSGDVPYPVTVRFTAGYGAAADVPETVKGLIRMLVAHYDNQRQASHASALSKVPFGVDDLINVLRWRRV